MFDIHNHILPGMDDGAPNEQESLAMARMAVEDGVKGIVCTPHWLSGYFDNTRAKVLEAVDSFRNLLEENSIPLTVYPGTELRLDYDLPRRIQSKELLTINDTGRYALIELAEDVVPQNMEGFIYNLQMQDVTPIIGHPERNRILIRDPMRLYKWIEMGVLTQVTASSILGRFGTDIQKFTVSLMEHNMAHIMASDAHGTNMRTPLLSESLEEAGKIVGLQRALDMVEETPRRIIQGDMVSCPDPEPLSRSQPTNSSSPLKKFFSFFKRGH